MALYDDSSEEDTSLPKGPNSQKANTSSASQKATENSPAGNPEASQRPGGPFFTQPGNLTDLNPVAWSDKISGIIDKIITDKKSAKFYNPAVQASAGAGSIPIRWRAFPKNFENVKKDKWKLADARENQDEYCEWEVTKNNEGKIVKVAFTCEVPEYWQHLAEENPQRLVEQYRKITGVAGIKQEDLFQDGKYNVDNKWNYRTPGAPTDSTAGGCIVHMRRPNNTLREAVDLVADATVVETEDGKDIIDPVKLLRKLNVSKESPKRESDPMIMRLINEQARKKQCVAVKNPAGLYIDAFDSDRFTGKNGDDVGDFWEFTRGSDGRRVRAEFKVPEGRGYVIGDIRDPNNLLISHGSQVAKYVWVIFTAQYIPQERAARRSTNQTSQAIYQYIEGRDIEPFELDKSTCASKLEPEYFGKYLAKCLSKDGPPLIFSKLVATLPPYTWRAYAADEGIGLQFQGTRPKVRVRLAIFCTPSVPTGPSADHPNTKVADVNKLVKNAFTVDTLTIVAVPPENDPTNVDSPSAFLQCAGYSKELGWFNFYDRERLSPENGPPRWLYFGCSKDAFTPDTQGLGPFCGHANGGIIMKEIDDPWLHWHTSSNNLELPENHPLHKQSLLKDEGDWNFGGGDDMARMVIKGTRAWFKKRLELDFGPGALVDPPKPDSTASRVHQWLAHVLLTTSLNIRVSTSDDEATFDIPEGFFFNRRALRLVLDNLADMEEDLALEAVSRDDYETVRKKLGLSTVYEYGKSSGDDKVAINAEGLAPWKILVACQEDIEGIQGILKVNLLPKKEIAALLMVDFWNPIFSWRRAKLMRYVPSTARFDGKKYLLGDGFTKAIRARVSDQGEDSPEAEYIRLIDEPGDFNINFPKKIKAYIDKVNRNLRSVEGIRNYMRLAESRRRMFKPPPRAEKPSHPLAEFNMALPYAMKVSEDQDLLFMREDGMVEGGRSPGSVWHPRNTQAHFSSSGCPFSASD